MTNRSKTFDVFIAHSAKDATLARELATTCLANGLEAVTNQELLQGGEAGDALWEALAEIPLGVLSQMISSTIFAISAEESRFTLNGALLILNDTGLVMVSTDGHRLARFELELPDGAGEIPGVIVPRKTVSELRRLLDDADGAIESGLAARADDNRATGADRRSDLRVISGMKNLSATFA